MPLRCTRWLTAAWHSLPPPGIRLASSAVVALALPQRPVVTLATQVVLALCISNSPVYCKCKVSALVCHALNTLVCHSCVRCTRLCACSVCINCLSTKLDSTRSPPVFTLQLLSEPLTQQRTLALASGLEYATLPLMALAPSGGLLSTGAAQALRGQFCGCVPSCLPGEFSVQCLAGIHAAQHAAALYCSKYGHVSVLSCACTTQLQHPPHALLSALRALLAL